MTPPSDTDVRELVERAREEAEAFGGSRFEDDLGNELATLFNDLATTLESLLPG